MRITIITLLLSIAWLSAYAEPEFRTFTNTAGTEMKAKINQVSGEDVYIERDDGLATKVDITIFSKSDQKYIRAWAREDMLKDGAIDVRFTNEVEDKSRFESNGGGIMRKTWKQSYGIVLKNTTHKDIKNIRIEYLILKFEDALAAQKRSEGEIKRLKGETQVKLLKAKEEAAAETERFPMLETKLESGYYWTDGGKKDSEDEMRGIWVRVYVGDILATEISRPENLQRKEVW